MKAKLRPKYLKNNSRYASPDRFPPCFTSRLLLGPEEVVAEQIAFHKDGPRGVHFRRACPGEKGIIQYTGGLRGARASSLAYRWDPPNGLTIWRSIDDYFKPEEVPACIVTCGGLRRGINTVILWSWEVMGVLI
ncbi:hypothetical protein OIU84_022018 [Salix udensis]|uniref:Uncharacterized protein n=1 Tax=Salix udensis TaxID=889485 RepID=A0AAD6KMS9_9ROSI|nr:hypothetical protein OIU84_022018 [Salix udensis]